MLQEPASFATAVQGLLAVQQQALASQSAAGGDHLCFLGSGREEEDQYTHMVVASFLQKLTTYVSLVAGGYSGNLKEQLFFIKNRDEILSPLAIIKLTFILSLQIMLNGVH